MGTTATDMKEAVRPEELEGESAEEIRARIEQTREDMAHTIDTIQERLNPDNLKAMAAGKIQDLTVGTAKRAAQRVVNTVAELTPQPRHDDPEYPYGDKAEARRACLAKAKAKIQRHQGLVAAGAAGLLLLTIAAKRGSRRRFSD